METDSINQEGGNKSLNCGGNNEKCSKNDEVNYSKMNINTMVTKLWNEGEEEFKDDSKVLSLDQINSTIY